jgi:hypothetical protein
MAPSNEYLVDEVVQRQLAGHDNKLIKGHTTWFPGEEPEVHWDFNRPKEFELLGAYLDGFQDIDFRDGNVTVRNAALATYGTVDDYLLGRVANTHLHPASAFNKAQTNGMVILATADGRIIRDDRLRVATEMHQAALDVATHRITKTVASAGKRVGASQRRALRIAPGAEKDLAVLTETTVDDIMGETRRALGRGE